ncbi:MAG: peptidylprolyl isomerase [Bacteroides sp.]|nr:peptidylprolyl isomerase [Bacteroides sp.]
MKFRKLFFAVIPVILSWIGAAAATSSNCSMTHSAQTSEKQTTVKMTTNLGDITMVLYNDTPLHRDNFIKLVNEGYYDGQLFHRVIPQFMAQAGDPLSRIAEPGQLLGEGDPGYTIPAEICYPAHFHKRGAIAAARTADEINPERRSSGSQFYIVTGKVYNEQQLRARERQINREIEQQIADSLAQQSREALMQLRRARDFKGINALQDEIIAKAEAEAKAHQFAFPAEVREAYTTIGGVPHLDGEYTVFGEVTEGMEIVEQFSQAERDRYDRPVEDVRIIKMTVVE